MSLRGLPDLLKGETPVIFTSTVSAIVPMRLRKISIKLIIPYRRRRKAIGRSQFVGKKLKQRPWGDPGNTKNAEVTSALHHRATLQSSLGTSTT